MYDFSCKMYNTLLLKMLCNKTKSENLTFYFFKLFFDELYIFSGNEWYTSLINLKAENAK